MRRNIFITYMIIVFISLSITGVFTVRAVEEYFTKTTEDMLLTHAKVLRTFLASELEQQKSLDEKMRTLSKEINTRITIVDLNGDVIADTEKNPKELENHRNRQEIKQAYMGRIGKSIRYSSSVKAMMMYVALPVLILLPCVCLYRFQKLIIFLNPYGELFFLQLLQD